MREIIASACATLVRYFVARRSTSGTLESKVRGAAGSSSKARQRIETASAWGKSARAASRRRLPT